MQEKARKLRLELLESKVESQEKRIQRLEEAELERQSRRDRRRKESPKRPNAEGLPASAEGERPAGTPSQPASELKKGIGA